MATGRGTFGGAISGGVVLRGHVAALGSSLRGARKAQLHLRGSLSLHSQLLSPVIGDDDNRMSPPLHPKAAICQLHPGEGTLLHLASPFPFRKPPWLPSSRPPLTRQASVDLIVVGPEPEDSLLPACHPIHGLSCHGLEVLGTLLAAEEVPDVAAHGAQHLQRQLWGEAEDSGGRESKSGPRSATTMVTRLRWQPHTPTLWLSPQTRLGARRAFACTQHPCPCHNLSGCPFPETQTPPGAPIPLSGPLWAAWTVSRWKTVQSPQG